MPGDRWTCRQTALLLPALRIRLIGATVMKWLPIDGSRVRLAAVPGWVLQLTHNGNQTLGVWSNGRSVFTILAGEA
jgi:hypothetical protein